MVRFRNLAYMNKAAQSSDKIPPPPEKGYLSLELGSGHNPNPNCYLHHDWTKHSLYISIVFDLDTIPWPLEPNSLEYIYSNHVFEHLKVDIADWLNECWKALKPGGILEFGVPRFNSCMVWCDPTHHRAFHENTMDYWDPSKENYKDGSLYFADRNKWWDVMYNKIGHKGRVLNFGMRVRK